MSGVSRHRTPPALALDHLVVAATSLDAGAAWIEERLGAQPTPGGKHVAMGTHNALVGLGRRCYLEIIAIDASAPAPARPRWFDLDMPAMRARLAAGPALIHWVVRAHDIEAAAACGDFGPIHPMQRGAYEWRITIPDDGHLRGDGLVPTLIEWTTPKHPAEALPERAIRVAALAGEHPEPAPIRANLARLGLSDTLKVTFGPKPRLAAMLQTPRGFVTL